MIQRLKFGPIAMFALLELQRLDMIYGFRIYFKNKKRKDGLPLKDAQFTVHLHLFRIISQPLF